MAASSPFAQKILKDILILLPVESILRFKSVSKIFEQLTSSPDFIEARLRRPSPILSILSRLYYTPSTYTDIVLITFLAKDLEPRYLTLWPDVEYLNIPLKWPPAKFPRIVGSVNGLVCLDLSTDHSSDFTLWNPATRLKRHLPCPSITHARCERIRSVFVGFGFDSLNNDYKIVRIVSFKGDFAVNRIEVYSWKQDSWKELESSSVFDCAQICGLDGVFVENSLNWTGVGIAPIQDRYVVISFDMQSETFEMITPEPMVYHSREVGNVKVMTYKGMLAVALLPFTFEPVGYNAEHFEFWVRDFTDGGFRTWRRIFSKENFPVDCVPMTTVGGCELVLKYTGTDPLEPRLFLHNLDTRYNTILRIDYVEVGNDVQCYSHVESLLPVEGRIYDVME